MSAARKRLQIGALDCGGTMTSNPWYIHAVGFLVMFVSLIFSYAALLEGGITLGLGGIVVGMVYLLLLYNHEFDTWYFHLGPLKAGGDAYDPERNLSDDAAYIEIDENEKQR